MAIGVINFPTSLDDLDTLIRAADNAVTTLASGITSGSTTIPLTSATKFASSGIATIIDNPASPTLIEIFTYTGKSSNDLTGASRGLYGTTASAFSAGATVVMRPVARHHGALADVILAIQQKIGYSSSVFRPLDVVGTNQAGNNLDITGGAGTGNAVPGIFRVRYPLIGASGTTLQSLNSAADSFPPATNLFTNVASGSAIANTTTETSLFANATPSAGSNRTLEAGITRAGTVYRVRITGGFGATAAPTGRVRAKFGANLLADTGTFTMPNTGGGVFIIQFDIHVSSIGATGSCAVQGFRAEFAPGTGLQTPSIAYAAGTQTIDFTASQLIDVTFQWGTANTLNTITLTQATIERLR